MTDLRSAEEESTLGAGSERERVLPALRARTPNPVVVADLGLLGLVAAALVGVYLLPTERKLALALSAADPSLATAFASHFVHLSPAHLLVNLGGFLLVAGTGYLLSYASGRRTQFLVAFVTFVLAFPVVVSALNVLVGRPGTAAGFSAVVLAFVGYLPIAILDFAGRRGSEPVDRRRSQWLFFLGLAVVAHAAAPGVYGALLATAALLASAVFAASLLGAVSPTDRAAVRAGVSVAGHAELLVVGLLLFFAYPLIAFPTSAAALLPAPGLGVEGGTIDVFSHALGFCLGYVVTYVMVLVTE